MYPSLKIRSFKALLALGTTIGSISGAHAQNVQLPRASDGETVARSLIGLDAGISRNGNTLNVQLRAAATVIDWKGFNVPEGATADFRTAPLIGQAAVLNRDVSGARSQLLGNITSGDNVAVWIMNPSGILVGGKAAFSTGSLVLTTLDVNQSDFLANGNRFGLSAPGDRKPGIEVVNGARINTANGPRGLVMVAPQIDANGTFDAGDGDVAFVTATDVTLNYNPGSPLSVTLNRGTSVGSRSQFIRGTVNGGDALFALASQGNVTDALLQVDAGVTTALAGTRGIVLSAGRPAAAVSGVATSSTAGAADGVASMLVQGALTTRDSNGGSDILAGASGTASFTGALTTERDVRIASGGALSVAGAVTARGGDYTLTGAGVTLGREPTPPSTTPVAVLQQAGGAVSIRAENGDITGRAGLTLRSGGSDDITLTSAGTSAGNIAFATGSTLEAGSNRGGALTVSLRDAANTLSLGNVRADVLRGAVGTGPTNDRLEVATAPALGDVDVRRNLDIVAGGGLRAGELRSDRSVNLNVAGTLAADAVRARDGNATLTGVGDTTITGTLAAAGNNADVSVTRTGTLSLTNVSAVRNITVEAASGSATVSGDVAAGLHYAVAGNAVTLGGTRDVRQAAEGDVRVTAGSGGINGGEGLTLLGNANAQGNDTFLLTIDPVRVAAGASGGAIAFAPGSLIAGGEQGITDVQVRSADANGAVTLGNVVARQLLGGVGTAASTTGITRNAAVTVGDVTVRGDVVLGGTSVSAGRLTSVAGAVRVAATGGDVTTGTIEADDDAVVSASGGASLGQVGAGGLARVEAAGLLRLRNGAGVGGNLSLSGGSVTLGAATYASGGAIDVRATGGGITGSGAVALTSSSADARDFVRLQATTADGIVLGDGSRIVAGSNRALRVGVFNAASGAPLVLGDVTARSLGALSALDGDATRAPNAITAAGDLAFAQLDLVDSFAAESTAGNLSVGAISVTGDGGGISLRAAGTLDVQRNVFASGNVTLASGADLTLGTVESRDARASVTSAGTARLDTLAGALGATLEGGTIVAREIRGGTVRAVATNGNATLTRAVGSDVTLSAIGRASLGGLEASGDAQVTGGSVALDGTQSAAGSYTAVSTAGALTGAAGLLITADADADGAAGGALSLTARGGAVTLEPGAQLVGGLNGDRAVSVMTDGAGVTLGRVRAGSLTVTGATGGGAAIRTGDLTIGSDLTLTAGSGVGTGAIVARGVSIDGGSGDATTGAIRADAVALRGASVRFGAATVSSLTATALGGDVEGGVIDASGSVAATATNDVTLASVGAASLRVDAGGLASTGDLSRGTAELRGASVRFGAATITSLTATALGGNIEGGAIDASGSVAATASNDVTLARVGATSLTIDAGRLASTGDLTRGAAELRGASVRFGAATVSSLTATALGGNVEGGAIDASGTVAVTASGDATLAGVGAASLTVDADGLASAGDLSRGTAELRGASVRFGAATVTSLTAVAASGNVEGGTVDATGAVGITATGDATLAGVAAASLTVDAGGLASTGDLTIADATELRGASVRFGSGTIGSLSAIAATGDVTGGSIGATRAVQLSASAGSVTAGSLSSETLDLSALTSVRADRLTVGGTATLRAQSVGFGDATIGSLSATADGGNLSGSAVTATGAVQLSATTGAVSLGNVAADALGVTAGTELQVGDLTTNAAASLGAGAVRFGTATVGSLAATASRGDVAGGSVTASGAITVASTTGAVTLGRLETNAAADIAAAGALRIGDIITRNSAVLRGGSVVVGAANTGSLRLDALAGTASLGDVTSAGDVGIAATQGLIAGRLTVGGDTTLSAGGTIALIGIEGRGGATLTATGANSDVAASGGITAQQSVTVTAGGSIRAPFIRSVQGDLTVAAPAGDVTGFAPGSGIALSAGPGRAFALRVGRAAVLGDLAGGSVLVEAPSLSVSGVDAGAGAVTLHATGGDLSAAGRITGRAVTLDATGRVGLADVVAGGALTISGGSGGVSVGTASGASIELASLGAVSGGALRADNNANVSGSGVSLGEIGTGGSATVGATGGDLTIGTVQARGNAALSASGTARVNGAAQVGGVYRLTGASIALGAGTQRAVGDVRLSAGRGGVAGAAGLVLGGGRVLIDSAGALAMSATRIETGGALALRVAGGQEVRLGNVQAGTIGGFDGNAPTATFTHDAPVSADEVTAGALAIRLTGGDLRLGRVRSSGTVALTTTSGAVATGAVDAGALSIAGGSGVTAGAVTVSGTVALTTTGGAVATGAIEAGALSIASGNGVTTGAVTVGGTASVSGASLTFGDVQAGALSLESVGAVGGANGTAPALATTAGDLSVTAGSMRLGTVRSAAAATLKGETISVSGRLAAARALLAEARAALTLSDAGAGDAMTLKAGGALSARALEAGGAVSASGAGVSIASARGGGAINVTSNGALSLAEANTGAGITLDAAGLATLGALNGGSSVDVRANDAELGAAIRATSVTFATRTPATTALRVGDGTGTDGFRLSAAELNRVSSDRLRLDAGAGALEIGAVAFGAGTGGSVDMLSTGDVRVTGAVSAAGAGRTVRVGGDGGDAALANTIHLVATSDAGGRLLLADNNLELRGNRIAAGLAPGFIDTLQPGEPGAAQASALVGNGNSALYNSQLGGGVFSPLANTLLSARTVTVRFGDYALFQNTGVPGTFAGVTIGSPAAAAGNTPVLRVSNTGNPAQASFALFGTINGVGEASAALLGTNVVDIDPRLLATSRINGCLAGSGAGCLTTIVIQPTLQVFNWNSADVFGISQDVSVPFQPIIGGNNEGLLTGLPELAPNDPTPMPVFVPPAAAPTATAPTPTAPPIIPATSAKEAIRP